MKMDTETARELALEILEATYLEHCHVEIHSVKVEQKELDPTQYNDWDLDVTIDHSIDGEMRQRNWLRQNHLNGPRPENMVWWQEIYR